MQGDASFAATLTRRGLARPEDVLGGVTVGEIYVMLGFACNIRCPICPFWGTTGVSHGGADKAFHAPFDPVAMERFLAGMRRFRPRQVNISGGEPTAFPHWVDVAAMAKRLGHRVTLTTNGSYLERNLPRIVEHVDVLQVSFTDPSEWRRGFRHADWATELGRLLGELKAQKPELEIAVNFAVSDRAVDELEPVADAALAMPISAFRVVHPMYLSPEVLAAHRADLAELGADGAFWRGFGTVPTTVDPEALVAALHRLKARHPGRVGIFPEMDDSEVPAYYTDPTSLPARYAGGCAAPWKQVCVVPNGDVWVCYDLVLGNIHRDDADDVWNGAAVRGLRQRILERGLFAGCRGCFNKYSS